MALSLQVLFPSASTDITLRQSRRSWTATKRRSGLQPAEHSQIIPVVDGDQNVGGLLSFRYLCNRLR
jgi:hypothetical protein